MATYAADETKIKTATTKSGSIRMQRNPPRPIGVGESFVVLVTGVIVVLEFLRFD